MSDTQTLEGVRSKRYPPLEERFAALVVKTETCWLWQGKPNTSGYGTIRDGGRKHRVHRIAWEWANGPIPDGMLVLHSCDTPRCVNPAHLSLGTVRDNNYDRDAKGRTKTPARKTHCIRGHELSGYNLYTFFDRKLGLTARACRACANMRQNARRRRNRALARAAREGTSNG